MHGPLNVKFWISTCNFQKILFKSLVIILRKILDNPSITSYMFISILHYLYVQRVLASKSHQGITNKNI
jgi:hypothetical protein